MDIQYLMRQAKKIEKAMEEARARLADLEVEAESGGGLVRVRMSGRFEVRRLEIDPGALEQHGAADLAMLSDLVAAAVNAAVDRARAASEEAMAQATGGLKVPGLGL